MYMPLMLLQVGIRMYFTYICFANIILIICSYLKNDKLNGITVDSRYLEFQGLSEILRDIRTSTYQICRIEEKIIRLTTFNKYMCD